MRVVAEEQGLSNCDGPKEMCKDGGWRYAWNSYACTPFMEKGSVSVPRVLKGGVSAFDTERLPDIGDSITVAAPPGLDVVE
jgi:hypothetical protein